MRYLPVLGAVISEGESRKSRRRGQITEYGLQSTDYRGRIKPFSVISTLYSVLDLVLPNLLHAGTVHWLASGGFKGVRGFGRGEAGAQGIGPRIYFTGAVAGGIGKFAQRQQVSGLGAVFRPGR